MYNVGLLPMSDDVHMLELNTNKKCSIALTRLRNEDYLDELENLDGVIIQNLFTDRVSHLFELIVQIKNTCSIPIWIHSRDQTETSRRINLELGVLGDIDASVPESEMLLIISNTLNLIQEKATSLDSTCFNQDDSDFVELLPANSSLKMKDGREIRLTRLEYRFMYLMVQKSGEVSSYDEIFKYVWNKSAFDEDKVYRVTNIAFHIRKKISNYGVKDRIHIKTVRSIGYVLNLRK